MKFVPDALTRGIARQVLLSQKNAPTLLLGAGVVGMIGSTVLACRATMKLEERLDRHRADLAVTKSEDYPPEERQKDVALIHARTLGTIARDYAPAIIVGAASIVMLTKSHGILMRRNAALTAAYVAVDEAFRRYRGRVREKYGEEEDRDLLYSHEEVQVLNPKGKLEIVKRADPDAPSMYARFFDETATAWSRDPEVNLAFLRSQQQWVNNLLKARGHVFLNEVYDELGLLRSTAGQAVGWVISDDGDNYIDFGISDNNSDRVRDFVNGREGSVLLDFNVDGIIYDKIDSNQRRHWKWQS